MNSRIFKYNAVIGFDLRMMTPLNGNQKIDECWKDLAERCHKRKRTVLHR